MSGRTDHVSNSCRFKLADVLCPDRGQVLNQITADLEVSGKVVFFSDQGAQPDRFAIVEVPGIGAPLIVPTERLDGGRPDTKTLNESSATG